MCSVAHLISALSENFATHYCNESGPCSTASLLLINGNHSCLLRFSCYFRYAGPLVFSLPARAMRRCACKWTNLVFVCNNK